MLKSNSFFKPLFFPIVLILGGVLLVTVVGATSKDDIVYPAAVLGGCIDESACKEYCEELEHIDACLDFAERHNLLTPAEIEFARQFADLGTTGPGDCRKESECEAYCQDLSHIDECLAFAERHRLMPADEIEEAKKVAKALREGAALPGGCRGKNECEAYCEDIDHIQECIEFAEKAGFLPPEELREARQVARALEAGVQLPGGCRGKEACEAYCQDPSHMAECFEFAAAAGFMTSEEIEEARRVLPLMQRGEMPGGCSSRETCEAYCSAAEHIEECVVFFERAGIMSAEDAELFRKTGGRGPGGCVGEHECEAFCNDPANREACFAFAKEHGLIAEEELEHLREGINRLQTEFENAPPEVTDCIRDVAGTEIIADIQAGTLLPGPEIGDQVRRCFEEFFTSSFEGAPHEGLEGPSQGGFLQEKTPEQIACMERVLGGALRAPTPEEERRIAAECFGAPEGFEGFEPDHAEDLGGFERLEPKHQEEIIIQDIEAQITSCIEQRLRSLGTFPTQEQQQRIREECFAASGQTAPAPAEEPAHIDEPAPAGTSLLEAGLERRRSILAAFSPFLALLLFAL